MIIDPELKSLMPELAKIEFELLEQSITQEGCRDPIILWGEIIIDGINRYNICQKNNITFGTTQKEFLNRDEAKIWIIKNQLGRRNLIPSVRAKLALQLKPIIKKKAKEHEKLSKVKGLQISANLKKDEQIHTDAELATLAGVSRDTIQKMGIIEELGTPELKEDVQAGKISINKAHKKIRSKNNKHKKEAKPKLKHQVKILMQLQKLWQDANEETQKKFLNWIEERRTNDEN